MRHQSMHTARQRRVPIPTNSRHRKRCAVVGAVGLAASAVGAVPATASQDGEGDGVRAGHSISVLHNIDLVGAFGYTGDMTIEVRRNGVVIGSANGTAREVEGSLGLEVNHGVESAPLPGDCWDGHTPDIMPGDSVRVIAEGGFDQVTVDEISLTQGPVEAANGDIVVRGVARHGLTGAPIPAAELTAVEFRDGSQFRRNPDVVTVDAAGNLEMRHQSPYDSDRNRDELDEAGRKASLLAGSHSAGFEGVAESQAVEGVGDTPGPAAGCEAAPLAQYAVTDVRPGVLNLANSGSEVTVSGVSQDADSVTVTLSDAAGTAVTSEAVTPAGAANGQTWTVTFTAEQVAGLDGPITVAGAYAVGDTTIEGRTQTLLKDTVAPARPTPSLARGVYRRPQRIALDAEPGARIRYTLGNGRQAAPTATRGLLYRGRQIAITATQVLKMVAIDRAGNVSPVARHRYRIGNVPSRPRIRPALSGSPGGRDTAVARWRRPAATNGRITGYRVTALKLRRNGSVAARKQSTMLKPSARSREMRLRSGRYRFRVKAFNAVGRSKLSARSNIVRSR